MQDVVLAMLAKEPSHGYDLRARLRLALGPLGEGLNAGQIYVTLGRLEKAGYVSCEAAEGLPDRPERKVWPRPDLTEFHLKLIAAAAAGLADPVALVDAQRRDLMPRLRDAQRAALAEPQGSDAALLLEGVVLRLEADLRWLDACERSWIGRRGKA
jgi:hypothetical protein